MPTANNSYKQWRAKWLKWTKMNKIYSGAKMQIIEENGKFNLCFDKLILSQSK